MSEHASSPTPRQTVDVQVKEEEEEEESTSSPLPPLSPTTSIGQKEVAASPSPARPRTTEAQRRALLRDDPQVQVFEPHRVQCRACQKWIRLASNGKYIQANWQTHKRRCPTPIRMTPSKPAISSRVAAAERQIVLLNDPQAKICSPRRVQCGNCTSMVILDGDVDYDLTKWAEHKESCIPTTPAPITPHALSHRQRMPPSLVEPQRSLTPVGDGSQSTETTVVAPVVGTKRDREEDEEEEGERASNRPRTETASLVGWFIHPLKEFARGLREGLSS